MFLLMKLSLVMVMRGTRHSFWGSPYLDEHGEEDKNLVRGKALYFNKERYEQLTQLYLSHRIEYDSRIAESTEIEDSDWY
jgi:E3 ubiquitin-protein ligase UBR3